MEINDSGAVIKVIGVGGAGGNVVNNMIRRQTHSTVQFIAANTDRQALNISQAGTVIQLGQTGLGAGSRPEMGMQAANEAREDIADALRGANLIFITAGMGGGTGTGAASIVAEVAQELGILTVAVVTKPFSFEGSKRMRIAEAGLVKLKQRVSSLIVILNDKLEDELGPDATMKDCFARADEVLYNACFGIAEIIQANGLINVDFEDVCTVMSERGTAMMGSGVGTGPDRAQQAASSAISCPLLEGVDLKGAKGVLINITASDNIRMSEFRTACETVKNFADPEATVIAGCVYDQEMGDELRVTVIATGLDQDGLDEDTRLAAPVAANTKPVPPQWKPQAPTVSAVNQPTAGNKDIFGQPLGAKPVEAPVTQAPAEPTPATAAQTPRTAPSQQPFDFRSEGFAASQPVQAPVQEPMQQAPVQSEPIAEQPVAQPAPVQPQAPRQPQQPTFGEFGYGRPIASPDAGNVFTQNKPQEQSTVFDVFKGNKSPFSMFGNSQGSGLWGSGTPNVRSGADKAEAAEADKAQFEREIPPFLRRKGE